MTIGVSTYCSWATMARPMAMMAATMPSVPAPPIVVQLPVAVVAAVLVRRRSTPSRTCCPSQTRTSVCLPAVMVGQLPERGAVDVGVPAQRAAANVVNRRRTP
jgi:hypothetical protein